MSLKECRLKAEMSVMDVARCMGVSDTCVYMWEKGKTSPRAEKLLLLAQLYGSTVEDLLRKEGMPA